MILNKAKLIRNGIDKSQQKCRSDMLSVLEFVLESIDPYKLVRQNLSLQGETLVIASKLKLDLRMYDNIYVVGAGKAVYGMALGVESVLGKRIHGGYINISALPSKNNLQNIHVNKARHPIPDKEGVRGTRSIKKILEEAGEKDLVIGVMSGGGSALMPLPAEGVRLKEKVKLTNLLLRTPARIHEINVVRKHLSQIKGGQFACYAYPATLVTLYISDITNDPFDIQASGPTAPDHSSFADAVHILKRYGIWSKTPTNIQKRLLIGVKGNIPETPDKNHEAFCEGNIHNFTIGNHQTAVNAASFTAKKLGYRVLELTSSIGGEAREVAKVLLSVGNHIQRYSRPIKKPAVVIAGGETVVTVKGRGKGGRSQELALSCIPYIQERMTMVAFGTDGVDGITPQPMAGAICDMSTKQQGERHELDVWRYLFRNDSYHYFEKIGDHIQTGPTGTNVGDLILLCVI